MAQVPRNDDKPCPPPAGTVTYPREGLRASKDLSAYSLSSTSGSRSIESNDPAGQGSPVPTPPHPRTSKKPRTQPSRTPVPAESPPPHAYGSPDPVGRFMSPEEVLTRALEDWARECPLCRAEGLVPSARTHGLPFYKGINAELVRQESSQLLQRITYRSGCCRGCGLPKTFCDGFQKHSDCAPLLFGDRTCYAPRVMAPTIISIGIFDTPRFELAIESIEGGDAIDMEDPDRAYK